MDYLMNQNGMSSVLQCSGSGEAARSIRIGSGWNGSFSENKDRLVSGTQVWGQI